MENDSSPKKRRNLTLYEAIIFKEQFIDTWKPVKEVWALKHGDEILGISSIGGSIFITYMFRKYLKLRPYARMTCYMPVVGLSAIFSSMVQQYFITTSIIQGRSCPLCITTKACLAQVGFGAIYPMISAGIVCFYMADKLLTYPVPPLVRAPKEVFQLYKKLVLKNPRPFLIVGALHMIAASYITYQKQINFADLDVERKKKKIYMN